MSTAKRVRKPPRQLVDYLRREAGEKCANPGCGAERTHIHHIKTWAVYETHDRQHMIAICPNCHDAVHHGALTISDATIYRWKQIPRAARTRRAHIYAEPSGQGVICLGTFPIRVRKAQRAVVFRLSEYQHLSFQLNALGIVLLELELRSVDGRVVLRTVDSHIEVPEGSDLEFEQRPGHVRVTTAAENDSFVPRWLLPRIREVARDFAASGRVTLLEIEVLKPGVVAVAGLWIDGTRAIVADRQFAFIVYENGGGYQLEGRCDEGPSIVVETEINEGVFGMAT